MNTRTHGPPANPIGRIVLAGAALLALALLSYGLSFVPLAGFGLGLALLVAAVKASIVLFAFMELSRLSASARLFALAAVFMLCLLAGLMAADVGSRGAGPEAPPSGAVIEQSR